MIEEISYLPLGAIIQSFRVDNIDIVLGFPTQELYGLHNTPHFGETIGRVANRISNAKVENLNSTAYTLVDNERGNTIHGWMGQSHMG
jgi:aldose 1-epimerase